MTTASSDAPLVLVTGGSGYIGSHVVQQLCAAGYRVRATVRSLADARKTAFLRSLVPPVELVEADLLNPGCWHGAVEGCTYVLHVASPFPPSSPKNKDDLIIPARQGTLNVLAACASAAHPPKRVVLTSSSSAIIGGRDHDAAKVFTESDWTQLDNKRAPVAAYAESKTLAERAAVDFMAGMSTPNFELNVICPGFVVGPPLSAASAVDCSSGEVVRRLLQRQMPAVPDLTFEAVDVRDVALAHILAMTHPAAGGQRFIVAPYSLSFVALAGVLAAEFNRQGYRVPTGQLSYALVWLGSWVDPTLALILPNVGRPARCDSSKASRVLGIVWREKDAAVLEMARAMVALGAVEDVSAGKAITAAWVGGGREAAMAVRNVEGIAWVAPPRLQSPQVAVGGGTTGAVGAP